MTRILTAADVAALLTHRRLHRRRRNASSAISARAASRRRKSLGVHARSGTFHVKAAAADVFAAKINANFPAQSAAHGLPTIQGVIVVMDLERGTPLGILDSTLITTLRTAAATRSRRSTSRARMPNDDDHRLRHPGPRACWKRCCACGRSRRCSRSTPTPPPPHASRRMTPRHRQSCDAASIEDAVAESDIVVTCTPSRSPILDARAHSHAGLFIAAVGADNPEKNELAPALLAQSRVVPDILDQAATMGDLHHAIAAGAMTRDDIHGELADVLCGRVPARRNDDEVFIFDSTGTALQDVATASIALSRAVERGIGVEVAFP